MGKLLLGRRGDRPLTRALGLDRQTLPTNNKINPPRPDAGGELPLRGDDLRGNDPGITSMNADAVVPVPKLFMPHPDLSDEVNRNIAQSEIEGCALGIPAPHLPQNRNVTNRGDPG
jgi:hypothetical protein